MTPRRTTLAAATKALSDAKSWTGRTHLHKHLFTVKALGLANVPFDFELYHYGPYSFGLDNAVAEMEAFGELDKRYRQPGYGPSYEITAIGEEALSELSPKERAVAEAVASKLARFGSADLELIATCLYVEVVEGETSNDLILPRVKEIKPKYSITQVEWALVRARRLRQDLEALHAPARGQARKAD